MKKGGNVKWFSELGSKDVATAGLKGAILSELYCQKFPVPAGFVITSEGYKEFVKHNGLQKHILDILQGLDLSNISSLERGAAKIRSLIEHADFPKDLKDSILESYEVLDVEKNNYTGASSGALDILRTGHEPPFVAVRGSSIPLDESEKNDLAFSGIHDSFLNVKGEDALLKHVKKSFASMFTERAIIYRKKHSISSENLSCGVVVQKMVDANKSGVVFSKNPIEEDENVFIEAVWGLGNGISRGKVSPDSYLVGKDFEVVNKKIGNKKIAFTRDSSGRTGAVNLTDEIGKREVLNGHELKIIAQTAKRIEDHCKKPQDIEFAIDENGIQILQSLPMNSFSKKNDSELEGNALISGKSGSQGFVSGVVKIIRDNEDLEKLKTGNVVVLKNSGRKALDSLHKASAVICESGGVSSRAVVAAREMGIPYVVSAEEATEKLSDGQTVTVDGFTGKILEGEAQERKSDIKEILPTKSLSLKLILTSADYARRAADSGIKEAGLVKIDSLVAEKGKHLVWYIKNNKLEDLIKVLNEDLSKISLPFRKIWIRTSDVLSDKYRNLEGSPEKFEQNPMLGDHGVRFSLKNQDLLEAELKAVKEVADSFSEKKFAVLFPHVISVKEFKAVKDVFSEVGIPENVSLGIMVETPAAVQVINDLCEAGVKVVNFNLKRLTQHTLAVDKNNEDVSDIYSEMDPAVLNSLSYVLRRCKKYGVETSVCWGRDTSPNLVKFLVENNVESISVEADKAHEVSKYVVDSESLDKPREVVNENAPEEDLVLKALEEDYEPGSVENKNSRDVPSLNEAIPVSDDDFASQENEEVQNQGFRLDDSEKEPEDTPEPTPEEPKEQEEPPQREFGPKHEADVPFEKEGEVVTRMEAEQEIQNSELREAAIKQQLGQAQNLFGQQGQESGPEGEEETQREDSEESKEDNSQEGANRIINESQDEVLDIF